MTRVRKSIVVSAIGAGAALLLVASSAWACLGNEVSPTISFFPNQGLPGSTVTVSGKAWSPAPVEIRWRGAGGPVLASEYGREFSVAVAVPEAAAGVYEIVAVQGAVAKSAPFRVVAAAAPAESPSGAGSPAGGTSVSTSGGADSAPANVSPGLGGIPVAPPAESNTVPDPSNSDRASSASAPAGLVPAGALGAPASPSASDAAPDAVAPAARPAPADLASLLSGDRSASAAAEARVPVAAAGAGAAQAEAAPSVRSASSDLWGGFSGTARRPPSLVDAPGSSASASPGTVAAWMLVCGALALSGGFAMSELRRRRAMAH
ncbi:MAG: hypothetical protein ABR540_02105, partial [Acidimicrobiales bacterium]